jgi:undecaprenyl diphosphate synthase
VENWKRPRAEIDTLMGLLREYVRRELRTLLENDIRFTTIGRIERLPEAVRKDLQWAEEETRGGGGLLFQIALSYGGRTEIVDAARSLLREMLDGGEPPEALDEGRVAAHLYTAGVPDPDLLIRTSGELRVSNFLLWQIAYSEIWVTDTLWPDFRREHFLEGIAAFQSRDRRFGGVKPAPSGEEGKGG